MLRFLVLAGFLVMAVQGMTERCTSKGVYYVRGYHFRSIKSDGTNYECKCTGDHCSKIICNKQRPLPGERVEPVVPVVPVVPDIPIVSVVTEAPPSDGDVDEDDDDEIIGREVDTPDSGTLGGVEISAGAPDYRCYDERRNIHVDVGEQFLRLTPMEYGLTKRENCQCKRIDERMELVCKPAYCKTPAPITPKRIQEYKYLLGDCFDAYTGQVHRTGESYKRTKFMNADKTIQGTYNCRCERGMMRCSAYDIPCCDIFTGEYVDLYGKVTVDNWRSPYIMNCTCLRQLGKYGYCSPVGQRRVPDRVTETIVSPISHIPPRQARPRQRPISYRPRYRPNYYNRQYPTRHRQYPARGAGDHQ